MSPNIDPAVLMAFAALLLSVLSPFFSAIINGYFRLKEKKLELKTERQKEEQAFYLSHRAEVIEKYLSAAGACSKSNTPENRALFGSVMGEIYLYVRSDLWPTLDAIASRISIDDAPELDGLTKSLCKELSRENVRRKHEDKPNRFTNEAPKHIKKNLFALVKDAVNGNTDRD